MASDYNTNFEKEMESELFNELGGNFSDMNYQVMSSSGYGRDSSEFQQNPKPDKKKKYYDGTVSDKPMIVYPEPPKGYDKMIENTKKRFEKNINNGSCLITSQIQDNSYENSPRRKTDNTKSQNTVGYGNKGKIVDNTNNDNDENQMRRSFYYKGKEKNYNTNQCEGVERVSMHGNNNSHIFVESQIRSGPTEPQNLQYTEVAK